MSRWCAMTVIIASSLAMVVIPAVLHRGAGVPSKVTVNRKGPLERGLLALVSLGFVLALVWVATPVLAFADYPLRPVPYAGGVALLALGLWLLYRTHADLGASWSITLEIREKQQLVTRGIYGRVRHPMYLALLLYGLGQALVLPNWVAGPAYGVAFTLLVCSRLDREERMLKEAFGADYEAYRARTKRLLPGVW